MSRNRSAGDGGECAEARQACSSGRRYHHRRCHACLRSPDNRMDGS